MKLNSILAMTALMSAEANSNVYSSRGKITKSNHSTDFILRRQKDIINRPKNMIDNWIPFEDLVWDNNIIKLRIDTRDFAGIKSDKVTVGKKEQPIKNLDRLRELNAAVKYHCLFSIEEVKEIVTRLYNDSGGKAQWRCLWLEDKGKNCSVGWDLKYLSILKTEYGYIIMSAHEERALFKYELMARMADQDILSTH